MADISDVQAADSVKIVGSDAAGVEQTPVQSTAAGGIHVNLRNNAGTEVLVSTETTLLSLKNLLTDQTNGATGALIAADTTTVTTIGANGQPIYTGSATAGSSTSFLLSNLTVQAISGYFRVSGTWVGTIQLEGTYDSLTYHRIPMFQETGQPIFSTSGNGLFIANLAGFSRYRWRATAFTSGTVAIDLRASQTNAAVSILNFPSNMALETTQTNGTARSRILDSTGTAIDALNSGAGLNALNVAFTGTNYVVSTNNSSVVQLASNAIFTGAIDNTFNQQAISILITSDQPGTLTLKQYSDVAGTRQVPDMVFNHAAGGISRSVTLNGNFTNITYKNTGFASTTTLKIDVAFGTIPATTALGNAQTSLDEINGTSITPRPDGYLRVSAEPTGLLYDTFETLDTVNTWTVGGTVVPTGAAGNLSVAPGTAANASSFAKSIPTFLPSSSSYLQMADLIQLEAGVVTGNRRFWGLGVYVTPTNSVPVTNGSIFEIESSTGNLHASTYSNSVRTNTVQITRPADGLFHRYAIYYKASRVYFEVDNVQVASISLPNPQVATLSTVIGSVNGVGIVASAPALNATVIGLSDTAKNANKIADGTFAWRTATVKPASTAPLSTDTALVVGIHPLSTISLKAHELAIGTTAAVGIALTATLPAAGAGLFHYISTVRITAYSTAPRTGSATPVVVTSTNLPGSAAWTFATAAGMGTVEEKVLEFDNSLKSSVANTVSTLVCPATASVIWRIYITYTTGI